MTTFAVGTGSVDASAALCDYLDGRIAEGDTVHAAAWLPDGSGTAVRDAADALNGVRSRLSVRASVETRRLDEDGSGGTASDGVAGALLAFAAEVGADELVVASGEGGIDPDAVAALVAGATRTTVVVPSG